MIRIGTSRRSHPQASLQHRLTETLRPAAQPVRPAVLRLGVGAFAAVAGLRRRGMFRALHRQDPARFAPIGVTRVLHRPLPPRIADALYDLSQLIGLAATAGIAHRVTGPLGAALQLWTLSYRNSWGMIFHHDNLVTLHQAVLGVTRSADALSVDALLREGELAPQRFDRAYGGVATAMNIAAACLYLVSGVAKVRSRWGWAWASGDSLREQIAADAIRKEVFGARAPRPAATLYRSRRGLGLLAMATLVVELGAPIALLDRRLGRLFAVAAWTMHLGIRLVMGIKFSYNTSGAAYLPFFPVGPQLPAGTA